MHFRILHYKTLDSTNNLAIHFAKEGAEEGAVITTDYQTQGRGRFKRRWQSPRGKGLLFSILLRPNLKSSSVSILTHLAAQSIADILRKSFELPVKLKKPNDVLVNGKKIAGILTESSAHHHRIEYVVIGIGLNVNTPRKDLLKTATSVYAETKEKANLGQTFEEILKAFKTRYLELIRQGHLMKKSEKAGSMQYA